MMENDQIYQAMKAAILDAADERPLPASCPMMAIEPFDAQDEDGALLRVVGVYDHPEELRFVVIEEDADGLMTPFATASVYRRQAAYQAPESSGVCQGKLVNSSSSTRC